MNQRLSIIDKSKDYINAIDFSMIIEKMIRMDGWLKKDAEDTCRFYRNFLFLKKKYGAEFVNLPPSLDIDEFWHYHILDTEKYVKDCQIIFVIYLPHYPYFGIDSATNSDDLNAAFKIVQDLHFKEFGYYINSTRQRRNKVTNYLRNSLYNLFLKFRGK
jgi:hypothetical protein